MVQSEKTYMPASKLCKCCKVVKSTDAFYPDRIKKDGLQSWCKDCRAWWSREHGHPTQTRWNREHVAQRVESNKQRYHEKQEEAGCHQDPRVWWPGYQLLKALEEAEVVNI